MRFSPVVGWLAVWCLWSSVLAGAELRTWTDRDGRTVEAELVRADAGNVVIRRADGREFTLPKTRLGEADLAYLEATAAVAGAKREVEAKPEPAAEGAEAERTKTLNKALGLPLWADGQLWDDAPGAVAERLGLRAESVTPGAETWRGYARPPLRVLGAAAYMLALRSEDGRLTGFSVMFTNRGDYPAFLERTSRAPIPKAELAAFGAELERDFIKVREALAAALPKAESEPTPALRREYPGELARFVFGEHELLLQMMPEQLLTLRVGSAGRAATARLSDEQVRQRLKARVTRRPNGDVVLDRIPMVDQGPKGYCVPATFERLLRYAGIPADLYDLAALGGTAHGGGTNVGELVEALERTVRQAGRKLEPVKVETLTPAALARYLDEGRPLLWSLASTQEFNQAADGHTKGRPAEAAELKTWAAQRKKAAEGISRDREAAHLCLIIGYNRTTGELAFSDSWGPGFAERWLPAAAMQQASLGQLWVLGF